MISYFFFFRCVCYSPMFALYGYFWRTWVMSLAHLPLIIRSSTAHIWRAGQLATWPARHMEKRADFVWRPAPAHNTFIICSSSAYNSLINRSSNSGSWRAGQLASRRARHMAKRSDSFWRSTAGHNTFIICSAHSPLINHS